MSWLIIVVFGVFCSCSAELSCMEEEAREYLAYLDKVICAGLHDLVEAGFDYNTNITELNRLKEVEQEARYPFYGATIKDFDWDSFNNSDMLRQASKYSLFSINVDPKVQQNLNEIVSLMADAGEKDYPICLYQNKTDCRTEYKKVVDEIFENTDDIDELEFYWNQVHGQVLKDVRPLFIKYIKASNDLAKAEGYKNMADMWMDDLEMFPINVFESTLINIWEQIRPIYVQYHAYIRNNLRQAYGEKVPSEGPIPIQTMSMDTGGEVSFYSAEATPYPKKTSIFSAHYELLKQNYTVMKLVRQIEDYYQSMGLGNLPDTFYTRSMFVQPSDRDVFCVGTAYDFYDKKDFRLSYCGDINVYDIDVFVHEIGHLHHFLGYKDQLCCYKNMPGAGLGEAVAESMTLSYISCDRLKQLGIVKYDCGADKEIELNSLFTKALTRLGALSYNLLVDLYRYQVFRGNIPVDKLNEGWWEYRLKYQGVVPPNKRSEEYFDAGDNSLITSDVEYMIYFFAYVLEFQFHEALCIEAGEFNPHDPASKPLDRCNLYGSKKAGSLLKKLHVLGDSKPPIDLIQVVTGQKKLDAGPMLRYFKPLHDWLIKENKRTGVPIGW